MSEPDAAMAQAEQAEREAYAAYDADRSDRSKREAYYAAYDQVTALSMRGKRACHGCGRVWPANYPDSCKSCGARPGRARG